MKSPVTMIRRRGRNFVYRTRHRPTFSETKPSPNRAETPSRFAYSMLVVSALLSRSNSEFRQVEHSDDGSIPKPRNGPDQRWF